MRRLGIAVLESEISCYFATDSQWPFFQYSMYLNPLTVSIAGNPGSATSSLYTDYSVLAKFVIKSGYVMWNLNVCPDI